MSQSPETHIELDTLLEPALTQSSNLTGPFPRAATPHLRTADLEDLSTSNPESAQAGNANYDIEEHQSSVIQLPPRTTLNDAISMSYPGIRGTFSAQSITIMGGTQYNINNSSTWNRYEDEDAGGHQSVIFQKSMDQLDVALVNLSQEARQLGSSAPLLAACAEIRDHLLVLLYLFQQTHPFYKDVKQDLPRVAKSAVGNSVGLKDFPRILQDLSLRVTLFLSHFNSLPEHLDKDVVLSMRLLNSSMLEFTFYLDRRADKINNFQHYSQSQVVQSMIYDLIPDFTKHIDSMKTSLLRFLSIGMPAIKVKESNSARNLTTLATIGIFLSGVVATALQYSLVLPEHDLVDVVNCFWFMSLIFAIVTAVNSSLALTWRQAVYRPRLDRTSILLSTLIHNSPLICLGISVIFFFLGLNLFTFASHQATWTSSVTLVFSIGSLFNLLVVSAWILLERQTYLRYGGEKSFRDVVLAIMTFSPIKDNSNLTRAFTWFLPMTLAVDKASEVRVPATGVVVSATKEPELTLESPIYHLQYSWHGRYLVINSLEKTQVMMDHNSNLADIGIHEMVGSVICSSTRDALLMNGNHTIYVVATRLPGVSQSLRQAVVECVAWFPNGTAFISVEGTSVHKIEYNDTAPCLRDALKFDLHPVNLFSVCITTDSRLVGIGTLLETPLGSRQHRCKVETLLVVYNMQTSRFENQVPIHDARDITRADVGDHFLIGGNSEGPQLWDIRTVDSPPSSRLILVRTYKLGDGAIKRGFTGFWGNRDEYVVFADKSGHMHIWDRETGNTLYQIRDFGSFSCISWNPVSGDSAELSMEFATGREDCNVALWTCKLPNMRSNPSSQSLV